MLDLLISPSFWGLATLGIVLTGISKSGFAGGAGVGAVPLLALVMPVPEAAALMLPLLIVMDIKTVWYYRLTVDRATLIKILPAALLGIAIAGIGLKFLSAMWLQIGLGVFSVVFALWHKIAPVLGQLRGAAFLWAGISGISSTLLHAGGPPLSIYLITQQLPKLVWLGTAAVFFAVMNAVKIIPYSLNNQWSLDLFVLDLVLLPIAFVGVWLGKKIQQRFDEATFMQICRGLLLLSGVLLLVKAALV